MSKNQYVTFETPRGIVKFPRLDQPYKWSKKDKRSVPSPDGDYETYLLLTKEAAAPLIAAIDEACKKEDIEPDTLPYKDEVEKETKKKTGLIEFKFKAYGQTKDGKPARLKYFDGKGTPLPTSFKLTYGSEIKIAGWVSVAQKGVRLNIKAIQVLKYIKPNDNPFKAEDDAWAYDGEDDNNNMTETTVANSNEEADDQKPYDF